MPTIFDNKDNAWKLKTLGWAQSRAEIMRAELEEKIKQVDKKELELYGSPTSMFYGLTCPGKYKCIRYIGEEYDISPDIIRTLQDLSIKAKYEHNIQKYLKIYSCPRFPNERYSRVPMDNNGRKIKCLEKFSPQGNWRRENNPIKRPTNYCVEWDARQRASTHNKCGALRMGGIVFNMEYQWLPGQHPQHPQQVSVLQPVLKRSRDNGIQYNKEDFLVIDKKTLYEACVNNCRYGDLVSMKMNKKQLFAHLLKYG